jgi:serine/threonine protein kinase
MILNEPHDFKVDIWSLAVCLLELANQQPPNFKHSIKAMFKVATEGLPNPLRRPEDWTPMFREFISKALTYDPKKRPPAAELLRVSL